MAWELSHSVDALDNALNNLLDVAMLANNGCRKSGEFLAVCYAENQTDFDKPNWERKYKRALLSALKIQRWFGWEGVVNEIFAYAVETIRTTDNGGHNLYLCKSGCHTIPFHRAEDLECHLDVQYNKFLRG